MPKNLYLYDRTIFFRRKYVPTASQLLSCNEPTVRADDTPREVLGHSKSVHWRLLDPPPPPPPARRRCDRQVHHECEHHRANHPCRRRSRCRPTPPPGFRFIARGEVLSLRYGLCSTTDRRDRQLQMHRTIPFPPLSIPFPSSATLAHNACDFRPSSHTSPSRRHLCTRCFQTD